MLDERAWFILQKMMERQSLDKAELLTITQLSSRQLEYSFEKINSWLTQYQQKIVEIENKQIKISQATKEFLVQKLADYYGTKDYLFNSEERSCYLFLLLFFYDQEYLSINHFIDALKVSKTTVLNDLKMLGKELSKYDITIRYNRQVGYRLQGNELAIRYYMMKLVILELSEESHDRLFELFIADNQLDSFDEVKKIVENKQKRYAIDFVENRLQEFIYTFIFLKKRINSHPVHLDNRYQLPALYETKEYLFSQELLNFFNMDTENANDYLCAWILGLSVGNPDQETTDREIIMTMVEKIMERFQTLSGIRFSSYKNVIRQLYRHFRPVYYRLYFRLPIVNPFCQKIKKEYQNLFQIVQETLKPFGAIFGASIPDEELAFLTMHFASLSSEFDEYKVNQTVALIVCPNGIGSSAIIYTELKNTFPEFVFLGPVETKELENLQDSYDIIFSTVPNIHLYYAKKPVFIVSPIMNTEEKYRIIRDVYGEIGTYKFKLPSVQQIVKIVEKYAKIKNKEELEKELYHYFIVHEELTEEEKGPELHEILLPEMISLKNRAKNWEEAIRFTAAPLLRSGKITRNYVETIVQNMKKENANMVITDYVALPHARPEDGVNEPAISLTVLEEPVYFGEEQNIPIKYLFFLAAIDNQYHLKAMSQLVQLLDNPHFYQLLDQSESQEVVHSFIKNKASTADHAR